MTKKHLVIIILSLLILVSVFLGINFQKQKIQEGNLLKDTPLKGTIHLSNSSNENLNEDAEKVILSFFASYYESLAILEEKDITNFFNTNNPASFENANINQGVLHYIIGHRKIQSNDLRVSSYVLEIDISSINKPSEDTIEIFLKEHSSVNFSFIPNTKSHTSSIPNDIKLIETTDGWKIQDYVRSEDINYLLEDLYQEAKEEQNSTEESSPEIINNIILELSKQSELEASDRLKAKEIYFSNFSQEKKIIYDKEWDNDYNRLNAVSYANEWVSPNRILRNPQWAIYDTHGGNCTNYISQCLFAGGIPMDYKGHSENQWKFYSDYIDGREVDRGRSPSWTGVNEFYKYVLNNSGFGLVSSADNEYFNGEIGDIIIFGTDNRWKHAVIISGVVKDKEGRIIDYLINSNTTDRINYPVSAYSYSNIQLIKILGWNE